MRKILIFVSILLLQGYASAQFTENFSDGDFTVNPAWTGDEASYKINTTFQLQLNATGDGIASLSTPNSMSTDMEWSFYAKLSFAPSDNNLARIYLTSDQADLKGALNGYYIKLGEGGSNDAIELVKQSGNIHTVICRGTDGLIAASFVVRIKVTRASGGLWKVFADPAAGINYQAQGSGTENTITSGSFLGVYSKFTSSNSTKFYYDDFYAGPVIVDNIPPQVLSVSLNNTNNLAVLFNEPVETATATNIGNYIVSPGSINPESAIKDIANPNLLQLTFAQPFGNDIDYTLGISNVKDLAGNSMVPVQFPFILHEVQTYDVLINEIMADPTPVVKLPDAEYVELYNRSAYPVDLKNWVLVLGGSVKTLPQYTLPAGGYVLLSDDGTKPLLVQYGAVIDFTSFAVTNAGGTITLKDPGGNVIHSVTYSDKWYQSSFKKDGGWSLELIDPLNPCGEAANWIACNNDDGGTPGKVNSVNAPNPDNSPPAISRVGVTDDMHISVWFTESCDSADMKNTANYTIDNGLGNPVSVSIQAPITS